LILTVFQYSRFDHGAIDKPNRSSYFFLTSMNLRKARTQALAAVIAQMTKAKALHACGSTGF